MTRTTSPEKPLGEAKARTLALLRDAPGRMTTIEIMRAIAKSDSHTRKAICELVQLALIDALEARKPPAPNSETRGRKILIYAITPAGLRALERHERPAVQANVAAPRTYHPSGEPWAVPVNGYYRNGGNKHIQSKGFPC